MRIAIFPVVLLAGVLLGACSDDLTVPDYNNPSIEELLDSPTRSNIAAAATGLIVGGRAEIDDRNGYVSLLGILGRESYNFDGADPRFITEMLESTLNPSSPAFGGNLWSERYRNIRTAIALLQALEKDIPGVTEAEKEAVRGFAKTMQGLELLLIVNTRDVNGAVVDIPADPLAAPGPLLGRAAVLRHVSGLLDEAQTHLGRGGPAFPFRLSSGFTGFDDPASFARFNRAFKARVEVYRGEHAAALAALEASFLSTSTPLEHGVFWSFGAGAGDADNELYDPGASPDILAHPSLVAAAEQGDRRVERKIRTLAESQTQRGITTRYAFKIYDGLSAPIPVIRNEELVLLRAEANWGLGRLEEAEDDINFIRVSSAGLAGIDDLAERGSAAVLDEILKQRRYSLMFEGGHSWIDARRHNRLDRLPLDLPSHRRNAAFPVPEAECLARGSQVCSAGG